MSCTTHEKQPEPVKVQRFGQVIKVKKEGEQQYIDYHRNPFPGVNEMIKACNIRNYYIFYKDDYLFAYLKQKITWSRQTVSILSITTPFSCSLKR